jgi:hypothetical protein
MRARQGCTVLSIYTLGKYATVESNGDPIPDKGRPRFNSVDSFSHAEGRSIGSRGRHAFTDGLMARVTQ